MTGSWRSGLETALAAGDVSAVREQAAAAVRSHADQRSDRDSMLDVLAAAAAEGSPVAVEVLAEMVDELGLARSAAAQKLSDEQAIEDVAQETLVSMVTSIGSFRGSSRFTTWLFGVAHNKAVDYVRAQQRREAHREVDVSLTERISSLVAERQTVAALLSKLPDHYRDAVTLRDIEQLPYAEIAERLGLNLNTAKSHVSRGRALLAGMIHDEHW